MMSQQSYCFWTCPACVHVRGLNLEEMSNRCRFIDQGASPIDGKAWEYEDYDLCPVFELKRDHQSMLVITGQ